MKKNSMITEEKLTTAGYQKSINKVNDTCFSKRIPGTISDFIINRNQNGLYYAPQIYTPDQLTIFIDPNKESSIQSMEEVDSYFHDAIKRVKN